MRPHSKSALVIVLDDLDFTWHRHEMDEVARLWNKGLDLAAIAQKVRPPKPKLRSKRNSIDEVALLIMYLIRRRTIRARPGGLWGSAVYDSLKEHTNTSRVEIRKK